MLSLSLDSPLYSISNVHIRRNILAIFVFGFVLGHVSFVIGAIIALEATRALIQVALYRSAWIRFLRDDVPKLFRKTQQGRITASKIEYNELTGEPERCWVSFEYHTAIRNDPKKLQQRLIERTIDSQDGNYSLEKVLYFLQQIQADEERTKSKRKISYVYMAQDVEIGFPFQYIEIKRQEQLFWARYVDICIVFFGFQLYFMAAFIHAKLSTEDVRDVMVRAALSPILMTPYLVVQSSFQHKQRIQAWKNDPLRVSSELESMQKYWQWMGPTWLRKFYGALFLLGVTGLFLCCGWMVLFLGLAMIYAIVEWIDVEAPIKRETLKEFQSQTKTVAATVDECWLEFSNSFLFGSTGYWVRISYITPSGDAVTKDVQSKMLYDLFAKQNRGNRSIEVLVHPDFPRSGYPSLQFFWDLRRSWSLCSWHVLSFVMMWFYLTTACFALDIDLDYPFEELIQPIAVMILCPLTMLPHASVWRRKWYSGYLQRLHDGRTIVDLDGIDNHAKTKRLSLYDRFKKILV